MYTFFAPCPLHFEDLLVQELQNLDATNIESGSSGAGFQGSLELLYRFALGSRIASRILLKLGEASVTGPEDLYAAAEALPWTDHFTREETFSIRATGYTKGLENSRFAGLKTKDALADHFRRVQGERPNVDSENPDIRIEVRLEKGRALFYLDLSGGSLSRRGYRDKTTQAPLRENLAAGLLIRSRWPEIAARGGALVDPFCGSGTLLIEGALMAADVPSQVLRGRFGFSRWRHHNRELFREIREEALALWHEKKQHIPPLYGFDNDMKAINAARENIRKAGLEEQIKIKHQALKDLTEELIPPGPGLVCTNPPYGKRLEEADHLEPLYRQLGYEMRTLFQGWRLGLITSESNLVYATGLKADERNNTMNGDIKAQIASFPPEQEPPLERLSPSGQQFLNRLKKNHKDRRKKARRQEVSCYRLYDADLPDYNAAIDLYENRWAVIQEYAPPVEIEEAKALRRLREIVTALTWTLDLNPQEIYLKERRRQRGKAQYKAAPVQSGDTTIIKEGGALLRVNFTGYIDTGIFLDHRPLRNRIAAEAEGKRFLNLFGYTGTATIRAALGGAASTVTIDASATYQEWTRENLKLNKLGDNHTLVRSDTAAYLENCRETFDLIMLDPPTFSNSKNRDESFDIQRDHPALLDLTWRVLAPGGTLYFSCNFRKFKMEWTPPEGTTLREITKETIPFDFERNPKIHYCWEIKKHPATGC